MGQRYTALTDRHRRFIEAQRIFFVGTAADTGRVNISPKGMDSLRITGPTQIQWLSVTGSGNESSAHVQMLSRMTLMFCAFEGDPMILRVYGRARVIHPRDAQWPSVYAMFAPIPGSRQIFQLDVDLVQTSCGMAVPNYKYQGDRDHLRKWAMKKGPEGIEAYWLDENRQSLDGFSTHIQAEPE